MRYSLKRVSGPAQEPITRGEAADHVHRDSDQTADDDLLDALIQTAREDCEDFTGRCFCWSTWELHLDSFPLEGDYEIRVPRPPLMQVLSIHYIDADGDLQELGSDNWIVDDKSEYPARIRPAFDRQWPEARDVMNAVKVTFLAGYPVDDSGSPTDYAAHVPQAIKQAIKLQIGALYSDRGETAKVELPPAAQALLRKLRVVDYVLSH